MTKRTFRTLSPEVSPEGAATWETPQQRRQVLHYWRRGVSKRHARRARALRVAWALADLFNTTTGYAFPGDRRLSRETGLSMRETQRGLTDLDKAGDIIRVHCVVDGKFERRVFPAGVQTIPATMAGTYRPLRPRPSPPDRYRKKERHYAAASTREATRSLADAWRGPWLP